jgi:hypothetical protein
MDYHFITNEERKIKSFTLVKMLKKFMPVILLSLILPFFVAFTITPPKLKFLTRADSELNLRIWLEPSSVVVEPNHEVEMKVMAKFESDQKLIPSISMEIKAPEAVEIEKKEIAHKIPFKGEVQIGSVKVKSAMAGKYQIEIPEDSIKIVALDEALSIETNPANLFVSE